MSCCTPILNERFEDGCIFCEIANNLDHNTEIISKTKELVCFKDICPAAPHHYLIVPVQHVDNIHSISRADVGVVKRMMAMARTVLKDKGIVDMNDIRMGFHQPPYTSVEHLHLHVLAPASKISKYMLYKFKPGTYRFLSLCQSQEVPRSDSDCDYDSDPDSGWIAQCYSDFSRVLLAWMNDKQKQTPQT